MYCTGDKHMVAELVQSLNSAKVDEGTEVVVGPTFVHLPHVIDNLQKPYEIAAQNCWVGGCGAFTGEVSYAPSSAFLSVATASKNTL